jgi:hypothetical protein
LFILRVIRSLETSEVLIAEEPFAIPSEIPEIGARFP